MIKDSAIIFNTASSVLIINDEHIDLNPRTEVQKIGLNIFWAQEEVSELILNKPLSIKKKKKFICFFAFKGKCSQNFCSGTQHVKF